VKQTAQERLQFDLDQVTTQGEEWLIGIDEVGYGCFAGSLVVGAVAINVKSFKENFENTLKEYQNLKKVRDSKKIQEKMREKIKDDLLKLSEGSNLFYYAYGESSVDEINELGMTKAHNLATERALLSLKEKSKLISCLIIIDGNKIDECLKAERISSVVKADDKSFTVGCAAILAKQYRDCMMKFLDQQFPGYDWDSNKGYGTLNHRAALKKLGLTKHHRLKYCKNHV
jgi:ribonuclease HII